MNNEELLKMFYVVMEKLNVYSLKISRKDFECVDFSKTICFDYLDDDKSLVISLKSEEVADE